MKSAERRVKSEEYSVMRSLHSSRSLRSLRRPSAPSGRTARSTCPLLATRPARLLVAIALVIYSAVTLLRGALGPGYMPCARLAETAHGRRVRVAGLVLNRQRPGSAKGVIFTPLEDETGIDGKP